MPVASIEWSKADDCSQDEEWKTLRKRFNAGFAPSHLMTLLPQILEKTEIFLRRLDAYAQSREVFSLHEVCVDLTFDIIGAVVMDMDFNAQDSRVVVHPIASSMRDLVETFIGFTPFTKLNPRIQWNRWCAGRTFDKAVKAAVQSAFAEMKDARGSHAEGEQKGKSVIALALQDVDVMTPFILQQTADQIKTFLFAGHDTTSLLLQWALYELSRHPRALETLEAELDSVFGAYTGPADVAEKLLSSTGAEALARLNYLSAVIKETLRLYPPAGSSRLAPEGSNFFLQLADGSNICLDGIEIYNWHYMTQRDPGVFGATAHEFMPERWLGDVGTSEEETNVVSVQEKEGMNTCGEKKFPPSAWRPFERGPRSCIGQELANLEARVILASVVRRYSFEKIGLGALKMKDGKPVLLHTTPPQYDVVEPLITVSQLMCGETSMLTQRAEEADYLEGFRRHDDACETQLIVSRSEIHQVEWALYKKNERKATKRAPGLMQHSVRNVNQHVHTRTIPV